MDDEQISTTAYTFAVRFTAAGEMPKMHLRGLKLSGAEAERRRIFRASVTAWECVLLDVVTELGVKRSERIIGLAPEPAPLGQGVTGSADFLALSDLLQRRRDSSEGYAPDLLGRLSQLLELAQRAVEDSMVVTGSQLSLVVGT